jgi:hypothetical protein
MISSMPSRTGSAAGGVAASWALAPSANVIEVIGSLGGLGSNALSSPVCDASGLSATPALEAAHAPLHVFKRA